MKKIFLLVDIIIIIFYTALLFIISELLRNCLYKNLYIDSKILPPIVFYSPTITLITVFMIIALYIIQIRFETHQAYLKMLSLQIAILYLIYFVMCVLLIIEPRISCP